jgi:hypothetical protein
MGTNPYKEKMPNRGMGREMGRDDDDKPQDVSIQVILCNGETESI